MFSLRLLSTKSPSQNVSHCRSSRITRGFCSSKEDPRRSAPRDVEEVDVVIVGAGPAGLSAAIKLKQLAAAENKEIRVVVVEKGASVGDHILSGCVLQPTALNELIPDWKEKGAPLNTPATKDQFWFLSKNSGIQLPTPPQMHNEGNYIVSLSNVVRWLGQQAEELGVEIFPGISASELLIGEKGNVAGIATGDVGISKGGDLLDTYARGLELKAKLTLIGEGCRGSLTRQLFDKFNLREGVDPQSYGIGLKEVWEVPKENHQPGLVVHTIGFPGDNFTYAGSFLYHLENNQIALGYVIGLDYTNTYLTPYKEFQKWKTHPKIRKFLEGGKPIYYGARLINEGGYQAIPKLDFPGGALIGCSAGFLNVPKIKGTHTAMKSGMVAAEVAYDQLKSSENSSEIPQMAEYQERLSKTWVYDELHKVRNIRPSFHSPLGVVGGLAYSALDTYVMRGKAPWTLHFKKPDHEYLKPAAECKKPDYPKPDGVITFDLLTNLARSGTNHNEDQPPHLKLKDPKVPIDVNLPIYDNPETRYCPAGVYEIAHKEDGAPYLQINAQNCLHCKTCDAKDPTQNIVYNPPEGGGGPAYAGM